MVCNLKRKCQGIKSRQKKLRKVVTFKNRDREDKIVNSDQQNDKPNKILQFANDEEYRWGSVRCIEDGLLRKILCLHLGAEKGNSSRVLDKIEGSYNRVHIMQFDDGSKCIIRVPQFGRPERWTEADARGFRSQVLTIRYIKRHTKLPVPDVIAYSAMCDNELGHPYMLTSFVEGSTMFDKWELYKYESPELEEKRRRMLKSLAHTMAELQRLEFPAGGMLYFETDNDDKPSIVPAYVDDEHDIHHTLHGLEHKPYFIPLEYSTKQVFDDALTKWGKQLTQNMSEEQIETSHHMKGHWFVLNIIKECMPFPKSQDNKAESIHSESTDTDAAAEKELDRPSRTLPTEGKGNKSDDDSFSPTAAPQDASESEPNEALSPTSEKSVDGKTFFSTNGSLGELSLPTITDEEHSSSAETFFLVPPDFDFQNIFVDDEGNVTAIIDWDNVKTKRRFQGWISMPAFLRADWMEFGELDFTKPQQGPWTSEHIERYRKLYARYLAEVTHGEGDGIYAAKSHLFDAVEEAIMYPHRTDTIIQMLLRTVLPPHTNTLEYLDRIGGQGWQPGERDWLVGRFKKLFECKAVGEEMLSVNHITKLEFLPAFKEAWKVAFSKENICSSFRDTGFILYNPEHVLSNLDVKLRTPLSATASQEAAWSSKTPSNPTEMQSQSEYIQGHITDYQNISPTVIHEAMNQFVNGTTAMSHQMVLLSARVKELEAANAVKHRRQRKRKKRLHQGGVLTAKEGRDLAFQAEVEAQIRAEAAGAKGKQRRCRLCGQSGHNARTCTRHQKVNVE